MGQLQIYGGKLLIVGGKLAVSEDCCCGCNCETDGPTADFSVRQTDDDPCTFEFTDESVAGACGEIVEWLWDFGDGNTSTEQHPSHAYSGAYPTAGPWDVTLTVTDASGCEDSVVSSVVCEVMHAACCCSGRFPDTVLVESAGWGGGADCPEDNCGGMNGTFVLGWNGGFGFSCAWANYDAYEDCRASASQGLILAAVTDYDATHCRVRVAFFNTNNVPGVFGNYRYEAIILTTDGCRGSFTLDFLDAINFGFWGLPCDYPATVTLVI